MLTRDTVKSIITGIWSRPSWGLKSLSGGRGLSSIIGCSATHITRGDTVGTWAAQVQSIGQGRHHTVQQPDEGSMEEVFAPADDEVGSSVVVGWLDCIASYPVSNGTRTLG